MNRVCRLIAVCGLFLATIAWSAPTTIDFSGAVVSTSSGGTALGVFVGDGLTGSLTFDPVGLSLFGAPTPAGQSYISFTQPTFFSMDIGGVAFSPIAPQFGTPRFGVQVGNNVGSFTIPGLLPALASPSDVLTIAVSLSNMISTPIANNVVARLYLIDRTATVFTDLTLPLTYDLSHFDDFYLTIHPTLSLVSNPPSVVAAVIAVPEVGSIHLLSIAAFFFLGVHLVRRANANCVTCSTKSR